MGFQKVPNNFIKITDGLVSYNDIVETEEILKVTQVTGTLLQKW